VTASNDEWTITDETSVLVRSTNQAPTVDAGPDQAAIEQAQVVLAGSAIDGDGSVDAIAWTQRSGPVVTLSDDTNPTATFTAPTVSEDVLIELALRATDDDGATAEDTVVILVSADNAPPVVDAGTDQTVDEQIVVHLSGTADDSDGTIAAQGWTQAAGPTVALSDPAALAPTFTAPTVTLATTLSFALEATDDEGASSMDTMAVTVLPVNAPPVVDAGADQDVDEQVAVQLLGAASDPDGTVDLVQWTQLGGPAVVLSDATIANPTFAAPTAASLTIVELELAATDDEGAQTPSTSTTWP
jgi:hypothetical protein